MKLSEAEDLMKRMAKIVEKDNVLVKEIMENGIMHKYYLKRYEKPSGTGNITDLDFSPIAIFESSEGYTKILDLKGVVEHFENKTK